MQAQDTAREALEAELAAAQMVGEWQIARRGRPEPAGVPHVWRWADVEGKLAQACSLASLDERGLRSLLLTNPGLGNRGTTLLLRAGLQALKPGESAWAHRHSMAALRFVVRGGPDAYTCVDGQRLAMDDGDLILQPAGSWHHHINRGGGTIVWFNALDSPLVGQLNALFYELHTERRPTETQPSGAPLVHPWRQAWDAVRAAPETPFDGRVHAYDVGASLATMDCRLQLLRPGATTRFHRHLSGEIYHVVSGSGTTRAAEAELSWAQGDTFVVPHWCHHAHTNPSPSRDAVLFCVSDAPVYRALGLYREEEGA